MLEKIRPERVDPAVVVLEDFMNPRFLFLRKAEGFRPLLRRRSALGLLTAGPPVKEEFIGKDTGSRAGGERQDQG